MCMQTRERVANIPGTWEICDYYHGPPFTDDPYSQNELIIPEYSPRYEIMTPNSDKGTRNEWKSFEHYKSAQVEPPRLSGMQMVIGFPGLITERGYYRTTVRNPWCGYVRNDSHGNMSLRYGDMGRLDSGLPSFVSPRPDGGFVPPPAQLDDLIGMAFRSIFPVIKAELSLPNFIYELKDFKQPVKHAMDFVKNPRIIKGLLKKFGPGYKSVSMSQAVRSAASNYLNAEFNILPLLSDIGKIRLALSRTSRRINDLINRAGRPQNKHFVYKWQEFIDEHDEPEYSGAVFWLMPAGHVCFSSRQVFYDSSVFHVQVQYNYNYTALQAQHAELLGHLDALGINFNPAIVWNALPWSFVVDWVFGVSRYLDSLKVHNLEPQINIHRFLWSVKRARRIYVTKGVKSEFGLLTSQNQMPMVKQSSYRRTVGMPSVSSIELSGLSSQEFSLGAALVLSRKRHRKHR